MRYSVTFLINKEKGKADGRLRCRVRWKGIISEMLVGYRVAISGWNTDTQRCRRNTFHNGVPAQKINLEIERMTERVASILDEVDNISKEDFKRRYEAIINPSTHGNGIVALMDEFITEESEHWAHGTCKRFMVVKRRIAEYDAGVTVDAIDAAWLHRYTAFMNRDHINSTVNKEIKLIRWFLRWCERKGYAVAQDCEGYRTKLKAPQNKVIFLDWDELMTVYNHPLKNVHDMEVRDAFCFCCFTGLRYSDLRALRQTDVHDDHISVTTIKTADSLDIPLNRYAKAILERYASRPDMKGKALKVCNNAEMNVDLKSIMRECGITAPVTITTYQGTQRHDEVKEKCDVISTHCGRRTFICNALMLGIPAEMVMKFTGHSDYDAMKPYIDVTEKAKADAMHAFDVR